MVYYFGGEKLIETICRDGEISPTGASAYVPAQAFAAWCPVDDRLVHKVRTAANFLSHWRSTSENAAEFRSAWVGNQEYYCVAPHGMNDPMLALETFRQAVIVVAHSMYGVPFESAFSLQHVGIRMNANHFAGAPDLGLELKPNFKDSRLVGLDIVVTFRLGTLVIGTGWGQLLVLEKARYLRLRKGAAPMDFCSDGDPTVPSRVGRTNVENVLLNAAEDSLTFNTSHKWLFDHPADHIPGMLIIEAARQAYALDKGGDPSFTCIDARFFRYGELFEPVRLVRETFNGWGRHGLSLEFHQLGKALAVVDISLGHSA